MRHLPLVSGLLLCLSAGGAWAQAVPEVPPAPALPPFPVPAPAAVDPRPAYLANLTACVARTKTCDRAALSVSDRNYLTYEMAEQRFSARDAEDVVAVRMEGWNRPETVILGNATGNRYASAPVPRRVSTSRPVRQVVVQPVKRERVVVTRRIVTVVRVVQRRLPALRPQVLHAQARAVVHPVVRR